MKIKCLIVDDEPLARKRLYSLILEMPTLNCLGESKTGKEAISMIEFLEPDLIFLDIQMKDMNGFDVLKRLTIKKKPLVIFVTAYDKYALKAFNYFAFDYLLKPFKKERFIKSVERVVKFIDNDKHKKHQEDFNKLFDYIDNTYQKKNNKIQNKKIPIKIGKTISFINIDTIKYITASGSYIDIHSIEKVHVLRSSLNDFIKSLNNTSFIRIHRSTVINIDFIQKLIHSNYSEIDVRMSDEKLFRVSGSYKKDFLRLMKI